MIFNLIHLSHHRIIGDLTMLGSINRMQVCR